LIDTAICFTKRICAAPATLRRSRNWEDWRPCSLLRFVARFISTGSRGVTDPSLDGSPALVQDLCDPYDCSSADPGVYASMPHLTEEMLYRLAQSGVVVSPLAHPKCISFINRSSLNQTYAARLSRADLGASNPLRHSDVGRNIDEVMPDDDVQSFRNYRPYESGGPLHVIGTCVNETVDHLTQREFEIAKEPVSPLAVGSEYWKGLARCGRKSETGANRKARRRPAHQSGRLPQDASSIARREWSPASSLATGGLKQVGMEELPLRFWISISGAAFGSGLGQSTTRALSLLFTCKCPNGLLVGRVCPRRNGSPTAGFLLRRLLWLCQGPLLHNLG
jgi:hypothetical protein